MGIGIRKTSVRSYIQLKKVHITVVGGKKDAYGFFNIPV